VGHTTTALTANRRSLARRWRSRRHSGREAVGGWLTGSLALLATLGMSTWRRSARLALGSPPDPPRTRAFGQSASRCWRRR
jgi:hypothetical protein